MSLRPCCSILGLNSAGSTAVHCKTTPVRALRRHRPGVDFSAFDKADMVASNTKKRRSSMDAVAAKGHDTADTHSHLVRPQDMEWQKTRFAGCEAKTLLFDRTTGLMTALMRFQPGAVLPDHEHVNIEQTYVLEGSLVDMEGPAKGIECRSDEYIW